MIEAEHSTLSISRQCALIGLARSSYYYEPISESEENLRLMLEIDKQYLNTPSFGSRLMTAYLKNVGYDINRKRIARLMKVMGLEAMYPKPRKDAWQRKWRKFPYLLKNLDITSQNHVWGTDITYIPVGGGYLYLSAVIDLFSRFVLSWQISNSLESTFCLDALERAFEHGVPKILNSDQGVQFTSSSYVELAQSKGIEISMSGKGRCWDNIFVERFWRSLKYEEVYLNHYGSFEDVYEGISNYIDLYNNRRPHSALNYRTPSTVYQAA